MILPFKIIVTGADSEIYLKYESKCTEEDSQKKKKTPGSNHVLVLVTFTKENGIIKA